MRSRAADRPPRSSRCSADDTRRHVVRTRHAAREPTSRGSRTRETRADGNRTKPSPLGGAVHAEARSAVVTAGSRRSWTNELWTRRSVRSKRRENRRTTRRARPNRCSASSSVGRKWKRRRVRGGSGEYQFDTLDLGKRFTGRDAARRRSHGRRRVCRGTTPARASRGALAMDAPARDAPLEIARSLAGSS